MCMAPARTSPSTWLSVKAFIETPVAVQDAGQHCQELSVPWLPDVVAEHSDGPL